jgi:hypothetical protein
VIVERAHAVSPGVNDDERVLVQLVPLAVRMLMVALVTFASVKLVVATAPLAPVAVTAYVATNQFGRLNESLMSPFASAVTSAFRTHVWPSLSLTLMWTDSPGCQLPPIRFTADPGA